MIVSPEDTTPTVMGLLAVGKTPQDFLPGAYIQFLRIDGTELADPVIDEEETGGSIVDVLRRTEEKLKAHNRVAVDIASQSTHQITMPYPQVALQQTENFGHPGVTDYRNPNIADVLKTFGFIQAFGRGIATARRAMDNNGNPPLSFETSQSAVVCTLQGKP